VLLVGVSKLAQLILDKVTLFDDHIELELRSGGLKSIMKEFVENEG